MNLNHPNEQAQAHLLQEQNTSNERSNSTSIIKQQENSGQQNLIQNQGKDKQGIQGLIVEEIRDSSQDQSYSLEHRNQVHEIQKEKSIINALENQDKQHIDQQHRKDSSQKPQNEQEGVELNQQNKDFHATEVIQEASQSIIIRKQQNSDENQQRESHQNVSINESSLIQIEENKENATSKNISQSNQNVKETIQNLRSQISLLEQQEEANETQKEIERKELINKKISQEQQKIQNLKNLHIKSENFSQDHEIYE